MGKLSVMPDLLNRDELERILAKAVGKEFGRELDDLLDALGDPPDPNNLPADFWEGKQMRTVVSPLLQKTFLTAAETLMMELNIGVEWGLINEGAITWVRGYTFDLVQGINNTSLNALRSSMETFYRDKLTKQELAELLRPTYGPVRSEMIAVTETTRAGVEGERELVRQIEIGNQNIKMIPIWETANDDLVCPICGPRHGQPITDGIYPPAHPRCRCWVNHEMTVIK